MWNSALRKTTWIRFGKAGAHPQLALGIAIAPETLYFITTFQFLRQLRFFRCSLRFLLHFIVQFCYLLRKCGLLAHTSPTFLKNCWIKKLFSCLRLVLGTPLKSGSARLGHIPSLPWESQLPLKPCFSLQPLDLKVNCDSYDSLLDFCFRLLCSFICSANVGYSPTPRQHFWKIAGAKNFLFACGLVFAATTF